MGRELLGFEGCKGKAMVDPREGKWTWFGGPRGTDGPVTSVYLIFWKRMSMKELGTKNCHLGDKERPPLIGTSDLWLSGAIVPWRVTIQPGPGGVVR